MNRALLNIFIVTLSILLNTGGSLAADKETKPILRIKTGRHTATITSLDADANGLYFVTSSTDKTIRLWDAVTGKLIKTLRPFIGKNPEEGVFVSVAMSPDGSTIACAFVAEPVSPPTDEKNPGGKKELHRSFTIEAYNT